MPDGEETKKPIATDAEPPIAKKPPTRHVDPAQSRWRSVALIFFCFVASFLGAGAVISSGLVKPDSTQTITQNRDAIVSQQGEAIAAVAQKVSSSVVSVNTQATTNTPFGGTTREGAGTGIIISRNGYVLTNKHVVPQGTQTVTVVLSDGTSYKNVKVVGRDPLNDIAFLKIGGVSSLTPATLGDSSKVAVGQNVVAIGNALGQYQTTVTSGIISALGRPLTAGDEASTETETLENLFQTDAAINPGNSGGPLLNLQGEVIGMNTAMAEDAQGIGFAIPINDAKGLIRTVLEKGTVERAYLGVRYVPITPSVVSEQNLSVKQGAYITGDSSASAVISGSPAAKAGLQDKDIITKVNGTAVDISHPLSSLLASFAPGDSISLTYIRGGQTKTVQVTLEKYNG